MSLHNVLTFIKSVTWDNNISINMYPLYAYEAPDDVCHIICTYSNVLNNQWNTFCNGSGAQDGDNYTLLNLDMPVEYIDEAQARLLAATRDYLNILSKPKNTFELKFDQQFLNKIAINNNYELAISDMVHVVSYANDLNDLFEIKQIRKKLNNIYNVEIIIGDTLPKTLLSKIKQVQFQSNNNYSNIVNNQTIINNNGGTFEWEIL
jgi:hypothetical protein